MSDRLPAALEVAGLRRQVEASGGFATVLKAGDEDRGSILLSILERGAYFGCLQRGLSRDGYSWRRTGPSEMSELAEFLDREHRIDPDLWLIELDVPHGERFIVDIAVTG